MEYTRLGDSGLPVSRLALGCMSYGDPATAAAHRWALGAAAAQPFFRPAVGVGDHVLGHGERVPGRNLRRQ